MEEPESGAAHQEGASTQQELRKNAPDLVEALPLVHACCHDETDQLNPTIYTDEAHPVSSVQLVDQFDASPVIAPVNWVEVKSVGD